MNVLGLEKDDDILTYFDVQNLSIDHPLTPDDVEEYKDLIFSPNSLHQIYFKDDCDIKSIQLIKDLLTISDYVDDSLIDKIILLKLSKKELQTLLSDKFENPETWSLPYAEENDNFSLTDLPRLRMLKAFVKKINVDGLSPLETVMKVYDIVKLMDFDNECKDESLPDIVSSLKTNSNGFNKLFSYILDSLGFKTFLGKIKTTDGDSYSITLVDIVDKEYGFDGIYVFDPSMDTLPKNKYEKINVRRVNYNFFGLPLEYYNRLSYGDKLDGILSILSIEDTDYSCEKMNVCKSNKILKERDRFLESFGLPYNKLHIILKRTNPIDIDTIIKINQRLYDNKIDNYEQLLKDNYETRKEELFTKNTEEELEKMIESESSNMNK